MKSIASNHTFWATSIHPATPAKTKVNFAVETVSVGSFCAKDIFFFATPSTLYTLFRCDPLECLCFFTNNLLKHWNGKFFESTTLTAIGYTLQLGHTPSDPCLDPSTLHDLMVIDLNGVHHIVVKYCHCIASADGGAHGVSRCTQLLREHWFPATIARLSTAFTFELLDFFHKLQDQNKCNPYDFYHTIIQHSDNAGLDQEIVSNPSFGMTETF